MVVHHFQVENRPRLPRSVDFLDHRLFTAGPQEEISVLELMGCDPAAADDPGFGDAMQFIRYMPILKAQGARVIFESDQASEQVPWD
jgi:hypothetical protein